MYRISTIQEMYDFAKDHLNELQTKEFQFWAEQINEENHIQILDDHNYTMPAKLSEFCNSNFQTNNKLLIQLLEWRLQKVNGDQYFLVIEKHVFQYIEKKQFKPKETVEQTTKQEKKLIKGSKIQEEIIQAQQQELPQSETEELIDNQIYTFKGRVLKKDQQITQGRFPFFSIIVQPEKGSKNCRGTVYNIIYFQEIDINKIYSFNRVQNKIISSIRTFKFNQDSLLLQCVGDQIPLKLKYQTISEIAREKKKSLVDLIAVVKVLNIVNQQKKCELPDRITYIVCDKSGELHLTIWKNKKFPITKTFQQQEFIVLKSVQFDVSDKDGQKYLNNLDESYLVESQQYEETNVNPQIISLKEWVLEKQIENISLTKPIITVSQLKQQIEQHNTQELKPLAACCYISNIESQRLTYYCCPKCSASMEKKQNIFTCKGKHDQIEVPNKSFHLYLCIKDEKEELQAVILDNQLAVQLLGRNADDFEKLNQATQNELLEAIKFKNYEIELLIGQKSNIITKISPLQLEEDFNQII